MNEQSHRSYGYWQILHCIHKAISIVIGKRDSFLGIFCRDSVQLTISLGNDLSSQRTAVQTRPYKYRPQHFYFMVISQRRWEHKYNASKHEFHYLEAKERTNGKGSAFEMLLSSRIYTIEWKAASDWMDVIDCSSM